MKKVILFLIISVNIYAQVTVEQTATGEGSPGTATFGSTPTSGNLLLAASFHRSAAGSSSSISGSGWTEHIERVTEIADGTYRRGFSVYSKTAGASEPTAVTITWSPAQTCRVIVMELSYTSATAFTINQVASNDNGTTSNATSIATGTTASVSAGSHLIVGAFGAKHGDNFETFTVNSWSSLAMTEAYEVNGGRFGRDLAFSYLVESASGTKASTANVEWTGGDPDDNDGLSAGILVFDVTLPGGGSPASTRQRMVN